MNYKLIIMGLLSTAYKMDDGKIAELLQDGKEGIDENEILTALLAQDTERVKQLMSKDTGKFQEGYSKGKKESLLELEKAAKEAFKIESDKTGLELIETIVTEATKAGGGKGSKEVTEDDVRSHKTFLDLEKRYKDDLKAKDSEYTTKLEELKAQQDKDKVQNTIASKAQDILNGLKPSLPENPTVAQNQTRWFLESIKDGNYKLGENGQVLLLDAEGKVLADAHGNNMDFESFVKNKAAEHFVFQVNNSGANGGNKTTTPSGGAGGTDYPQGITKPKTEEEMWATVSDTKFSAEDRQTVLKVWNEENSK